MKAEWPLLTSLRFNFIVGVDVVKALTLTLCFIGSSVD